LVDEKSLQIALEYIKAGKGKRTSGELVGYMDSPDIEFEYRTTEMTTRYTIITRLKQRGSIIIPKHRPGQKQYLIFNDKSEFDMIASMTDKIKSGIEAMDGPIQGLSVLRAKLATKAKSETDEATRDRQSLGLLHHMEKQYTENYSLMLQFLWEFIEKTIQLENDRQILHTRIAILITKIIRQFWGSRPLTEIFRLNSFGPEIAKLRLSKKIGISGELIEKLNATQEDFVRLFELR
jgi:hypothetical protein